MNDSATHQDPISPLGAAIARSMPSMADVLAAASTGHVPPPVDEPDRDTERAAARQAQWERIIPLRFRDARVDDLPAEVAAAVQQRMDDPTRNLLILGGIGAGKTHAAVAAARLAFDAGQHIAFVPVVELLEQMRPERDPRGAMERAIASDLVVLDDLGVERPSDWTDERLYAVINRRWLECRPIIATSNLDPDGFEEAIGKRLASRLYHGAVRTRIGCEDRRRG